MYRHGALAQEFVRMKWSAATQPAPAQELPNPISPNWSSFRNHIANTLNPTHRGILHVVIGNCLSWPKRYACATYFPTQGPTPRLSPCGEFCQQLRSVQTELAVISCSQLTRLTTELKCCVMDHIRHKLNEKETWPLQFCTSSSSSGGVHEWNASNGRETYSVKPDIVLKFQRHTRTHTTQTGILVSLLNRIRQQLVCQLIEDFTTVHIPYRDS
jgi:hypothetical protein